MLKKRAITVMPSEAGWVVQLHGKTVASFERKREATQRGREMLKQRGGGDLVIHSLSGRIVDHDSVPAARH